LKEPPLEQPLKEPQPEDALPHVGDPFGFDIHNLIWLCGTAVVALTLVVLTKMGVIH
jgi:hypothetical protein